MKKFLLLTQILVFGLFTVQAQTTHYVKETATGTGDGSSWQNASDDLQLMINTAMANDSIWVAGGTYVPIRRADALNTITIDDRNNAFVLKNSLQIFGGFAGIESLLTERDLSLTENASILSGDLGTPDDANDNAVHVVISTENNDSAVLDGFTISGGNATYGMTAETIQVNGESIYPTDGAGIYIANASPTFLNLTISDNSAFDMGGGIYIEYSAPATFSNVSISQN